MSAADERAVMLDFEPATEQFRHEVLEGLAQRPRTLPCKYLYDEEGSRLFDAICELEEYYPTRTEQAIMNESIDEMAWMIGPSCLLIEYGSGSSLKTRLLLDRLNAPVGYVPIDISREHLKKTADALRADYPELDIQPVCADYTAPFELPPTGERAPSRRVIYFPGSTIGNFSRERAERFLRGMHAVCGENGGVLIGVDLKKSPARLTAAYNDREGITAAFNRNLLARINRELGADFDVDRFEHHAPYNPIAGRVEMHLVSLADQTVTISGHRFSLKRGETIWTESSHKYSPDEFAAMAGRAGFRVERFWTDPEQLFSIQWLRACQG